MKLRSFQVSKMKVLCSSPPVPTHPGRPGAGRAENPPKLGLQVLSASYLGVGGLTSLPMGIHFNGFPGREMSKCFKVQLKIWKFSKSFESLKRIAKVDNVSQFSKT